VIELQEHLVVVADEAASPPEQKRFSAYVGDAVPGAHRAGNGPIYDGLASAKGRLARAATFTQTARMEQSGSRPTGVWRSASLNFYSAFFRLARRSLLVVVECQKYATSSTFEAPRTVPLISYCRDAS
jgi:hypothetical protein